MVQTYGTVHNSEYWQLVDPLVRDLAGGRIAEIGCGPGLLLKDLYERYHPEHLFGIDLSEHMLNRAREFLAPAINEGRVTLIQQHMQEDPSLPPDLDLIFSSRVLRSFEDQEAIFSSIQSSLKVGGRIVLLDWAQASIKTYQDWFNRDSNSHFDDVDIGMLLRYHRIFSRYSLEDWEFILTNFGFKVLLKKQLTPVRLLVVAEKT